MNLSDPSGDDDSSSDESPIPQKRARVDTYGASSTTSHGSVLQESDDEPSELPNSKYIRSGQSSNRLNSSELSPDDNVRRSRSSLSENCSSPNDQYDDYRPSLDDNDRESGQSSGRPSFQDANESPFFKNQYNHVEDSYGQSYSDMSKRMMSNMGFKPGRGLGKREDGRVEPVEASTQKGRRGLGLKPSIVGDVPQNFTWSADDAKPEAKEEVMWMPAPPEETLISYQLDEWLKKGPKKLTIDDEVDFVEPNILKGVLDAKTIFDSLDDEDLRNARFRSNPYETIGSVMFLNRAAVKMANMDAVFDFMFTKPKKPNGESFVDKKEILYFADVCAGPGGFSEYVLYRRGWKAKGFGFTLKGGNDFKLSDFYAGTPETFNPFYGAKDDGNIFDPANLTSLKEHVLTQTDDKGVHFLMADGNYKYFYCKSFDNEHVEIDSISKAFNQLELNELTRDLRLSKTAAKLLTLRLREKNLIKTNDKMHSGQGHGFSVEGQENIQEILSKQLYLCQCLAALMLVRTGGHFVVKLFDVFTLFSVGLIYIMYRCFEQVSIHKPVTSRPANSERYLICKWKKLGTESAENHLFTVNTMLKNGVDRDTDVTELVPLTVIQEDRGFYEYIYKSNCLLGEKQIKNLIKIAKFSKDKNLKEQSQAEMRAQCLKLWHLPDKVRTQPERLSPVDTLSTILTIVTTSAAQMKRLIPDSHSPQDFKANVLNKQPEYINSKTDLDLFKSVYDWHFTFLSSGKRSPNLKIFIGCGGKQVYQLDDNNWRNVADLHLTLPAKTLIYGEIVKEYIGEGSNQMHSKALHIIDAMILGGNDISYLPLTERINQCDLFCTALNKPLFTQALPIRCKRLYNMEQFSSAVNHLEYRAMKRVKQAVTINTPKRMNMEQKYYEVGSILFIKEIKEPWVAHMSKKSGHKYYYCIGGINQKPRSEYFIPDEARLDMTNAYLNRVMWPWEPVASAVLEGSLQNGVSKIDMEEFIMRNIKK